MRRQRGSVSVEVAAVLPLIAVAMLLVGQVGLLVAEQLVVQHAAREGVRAAAILNDDDAARAAVLGAGNLPASRTTVSVEPASRDVGAPVTVTVVYEPTVMPVIARFVPDDLRLRASASMRTEREPPPSEQPTEPSGEPSPSEP